MNPHDPLSLRREAPHLSAHRVVSRGQAIGLIALALLVAIAVYADAFHSALGIVFLCCAFYLLFTTYRLLLLVRSIGSRAEIRFTPGELAAVDESSLPVYSVLVPMYHEPESVKGLVQALSAMRYPAEKLDIQLLLEEDDRPTRDAADALDLPAFVRVTLIPPSHPRTKPKACNVGLALACGEYLVIYDAEDRPESDQLLKAVLGFRRAGKRVICLQSKLNFYNPRQNWITRWFTSEYCAWFDLSLPGLASMNAVIPLGGTSNHFHTETLKQLHGWDAYNVTEDCDLGIRIYRKGYASRMLDTTTWEEACGSLPFWIRQRTRWLKGYMQTYLVHTRHPLRMLREFGPSNFLHFHLLIGGVPLCFLLNPIFWTLTGIWFVFRNEALASLFPTPVFAMGVLCLFAGNFAITYSGALGCFRRGYFDLVKYALLIAPYWFLMSVAGWRALFQLISNPFLWEKTQHGLAKTENVE